MTIGEKIRRIRKFRHMKQRELAVAIGLDEKSVSRIGQYEIGYRVPQKETLEQISRALNVNILNFVELKRFPNEKCNSVEDTSVYYHDSDSWPTHEPMGLWFNNTLLCNFIEEWANHKKELLRGEITKEQYFEWKITWPYSCHK